MISLTAIPSEPRMKNVSKFLLFSSYSGNYLRQSVRNMSERKSCVFCQIYDTDKEQKVIYKDEEYCVFPDIRPAAKHHYLVIPREHIPNAKVLNSGQRYLLERLVEIGKEILSEQGGDLNDVRFGFHWPPFNSISHLHLHVISPASEMGFVSRMVFKPDTWWFITPEAALARLQ